MDWDTKWPGVRSVVALITLVLCCCQGNTANPPNDAGTDDGTDDWTDETDVLRVVGCEDLIQEEPDGLPDRVIFRGKKQSFNLYWYVVLQGGAIWIKPNEEFGEPAGEWRLIGDSGMPEGDELDNFGVPGFIEEISCDGVHLMALSGGGHFYRCTDMTTDLWGGPVWTDAWGGVTGYGPGLSSERPTTCGWSVMDSHPLGVAHYEDINGTQHSVGLGVGHIYRLLDDGYDIHFNDWWLPEDWSRQICGPERGTFRAVNISASASTIFVVGEQGRLFTRLYDFDTAGENLLLTYSYVIEGESGTTRKLPAEDWREQPAPGGRITPRITIFQNGQGNAARVLRIEGTMGDVGGYFEKQIEEEVWVFHETGETVAGPFLDGGASEPREPADMAPFTGTLSATGRMLDIELLDLNMICSPARARLLWEGEPVTAGGGEVELQFHHVHTWVEETRPIAYWELGIAAQVQAALLVPDELGDIDDPDARTAVAALFGDREVVNFLGTISPEAVELSEITWDQPFRVPAEEKALLNPLQMSLTP